jgi:hypothetical protein
LITKFEEFWEDGNETKMPIPIYFQKAITIKIETKFYLANMQTNSKKLLFRTTLKLHGKHPMDILLDVPLSNFIILVPYEKAIVLFYR